MLVAEAFSTALARHQAGDFNSAEALYRKIVARSPEFAQAWHLLGVLAYERGELDGAAEFYAKALERQPGLVETHFALGVIRDKQGAVDKAIVHYERTLRLDGRHASACFNLAHALGRRGQIERSREQYERYLVLRPGDVQALNNLGNLFQDRGDLGSAVRCYREAVTVEPGCGEAHFNLGLALYRSKRVDDSARHFQQAAELIPSVPEVHNRLGDVLVAQGQVDAAQQRYAAACRLRPRNLLWRLRAEMLAPPVFFSVDEIEEYRTRLAETLRHYQDFSSTLAVNVGDIPDSGGKPPMDLAYQGRDDLELKRLFAALLAGRFATARPYKNLGMPRIGFVVTAGHEGVFLRGMAGMLEHFSKGRFQIAVICSPSGEQTLRGGINRSDVDFLPLSGNFQQAIADLREARFDLLYFWEVGTDSINYFLPIFRAAPVQCTSWGWPVTSGLAEIDFFVSSELLEPPHAQSHYRERLVQLRQIPNFYRRPAAAMFEVDRSWLGVSPGQHLYGCVQNPRKIHPDFDQLLGGILRNDPRGIVLIVSAARSHITKLLAERFRRNIPDVAERIRFVPRMGRMDYLRFSASLDVLLDTLHYGGGANTTYDSLAIGVPVVTLPGEFHRGRYAMATYRQLGIGDCVATSSEDYVACAVRLGSEPDYRNDVRRRILERVDMLFENRAAVAELEEFFDRAIVNARAAGA